MSKLVKLSPELSNELQQIKSKRKESASNQNKLNDFHEKVSSENGLSEDEKTELIRFYKNAVEISQKEEILLKSALGKIQDLIEQIEKEEVKAVVQNVSQKEVKSNDEEPKKGDKVAARVSGDNFWILASFVQVIDRNKYEVEDEDTEQLSDDSESHQIRKRYKLQKNRIIPLQKVFNDHVIFEKGSSVYAVFPETTCFYSAVIEKQPTQSSQFYQVRFEDDEDDNGNPTTRKVSFKYVLDSSLFK